VSSRLSLTLSELEAFVAVVEQGNFSRAAVELGLSQPTVSQRVQMLESQCGLRLLDRRQGVRLTENGRQIYNKARSVLAGANEVEAIAQELSGLARGRLKIGFSTPPLAIQILAQLRSAYPAIEISASHGNTVDLLDAINSCDIDVGLMTLVEIPEGLRAERLVEQQPMLCLAAGDALEHRRSLRLKEIRTRMIILRELGSLTRRMFEAACRSQGVRFDNVLILPSREAVKEAVAAGLGIGVVLSGEIGSDTRITSIAINDCSSTGGIYAVSLKETAGLPLIDAFFSVCRDAALDEQAQSAPSALVD